MTRRLYFGTLLAVLLISATSVVPSIAGAQEVSEDAPAPSEAPRGAMVFVPEGDPAPFTGALINEERIDWYKEMEDSLIQLRNEVGGLKQLSDQKNLIINAQDKRISLARKSKPELVFIGGLVAGMALTAISVTLAGQLVK